jgi:hypothetical protein
VDAAFMSLLRQERGIHALRSGTGVVKVTKVRFLFGAVARVPAFCRAGRAANVVGGGGGVVAEDLILPVPRLMSAVYLVPVALSAAAARDRAAAGLAARVASPVGVAARMMLDAGTVTVAVVPSSSLPPFGGRLQEHRGVDPGLVRVVTAAAEFVMIRAVSSPGWPPMHEWAGRACAAVLAAEAGVPLVDTATPQVLTADVALRTLPAAEDDRFRLADWVLVFQSARRGGLWMTTKGLGRFGLPELQVRYVPPQLGRAWTRVLNGVASRLLSIWLRALRDQAGSAFAQLPELLEVREGDIARAYDAPRTDGPAVAIRLTFDPSPEDNADSFVSIQPPDDYPASAGEFMAGVHAALFGQSGQEIRHLAPSAEMDRAVRAAREALPAVRARFLAGDLPSRAQLMIKHEVAAQGRAEYPWAYVTSWADPDRVLGNSAGDAALDPAIRAGRPIVVDAWAIIDWAIWIDGRGIVEGGQTNVIAQG